MRVLAFATIAATLSAPLCVSALLTLEKRSFQTSAVCLSDNSWVDNSKSVSPCYLAAVVLGSCAGNNWLVPAISASSHYTTPNATSANLCSCSWAAYNLLSACTLCQGFQQSIGTWPVYSINCGNNLSPSYFPSQLTVPDGTLLPWYAATNPTKWTNEEFNFVDAHTIALQGHADVTLGATSTSQKKSTHVGAIVGGVVGGLAALFLIAAALLLYRRRLMGKPLKPSLFGVGHVKSLSDTSQMTSGLTLGYHGMDGSFATPSRPIVTHTRSDSENSHSYFGSVAQSADLFSSASPSPGVTGEIQHMNPQDIIVPFVVPHDQQRPSHNQGDRKRPDGAIIPVYNHPHSSHAADASTSNGDHPSSQRINPPAYTAYPGPADVMSTGSRARTRASAHNKQGSADTSFSADSTPRSASPMTTVPSASSIPGLDDVVEKMRLGRPEPMSGTGGTLATGMSAQLPRIRMVRPVVENPDPSPI